jgi:hypothetical protein
MNKHTHTPWSKGGATVYAIVDGSRPLMNHAVAQCLPGVTSHAGDDQETAFDNCEFIVRACNAHESLLDAAKLALSLLLDVQEEENPEFFITISALNRAITRAKS